MAQQLVKLIQWGSAENHIFAFEVVGGAPGFPGYSVEEFTGTTDGSGEMTVTLSRAPAHLAGCFCMVGEDERVIAPISVGGTGGKVLTLRKRKLKYDKPQDSHTDHTGAVESSTAPSGIAVSSSAQHTGDTAPAATSTGPGATTAPVGGAAGDAVVSVGGVTTTVDAHHHSMDFLYDHKHKLTFDSTSLELAVSEATRVLVLYS